jgi:hypothetical protein
MNNETARWMNAVLEADGWRCQLCGTNRHLDAAYILPKSSHPERQHFQSLR